MNKTNNIQNLKLAQLQEATKIIKLILSKKDNIKGRFDQLKEILFLRINSMAQGKISIPKGKRGYHTMSKINNSSLVSVSNNKIKNNPLNKYLSAVEDIVKDPKLTSYDKQYTLENKWLDLITEQHNDLDYLKLRYSNQFVNKLFKAKETLDILDRNGRIKKIFPSIYLFLNKYEILLLSYGLAINGVNMKMGYNNICSLIGKKVIYQIFLGFLNNSTKFKSIIESNNILDLINYFSGGNKDISVFFDIIDFSNTDYIKLGSFLLDLLIMYPVDLFEKIFDESSNPAKNELARLKFNDRNFEDIKNNLIIDPASLPMLCEPCKWSDSEYGGYILNKDLKQDIITGSTYHGHKMENRDNLYKAINKMSSIKFGFNNKLLEYLENEGNYLVRSLEEKVTKSELYQIYTQINVAKAYSSVPFYIPLNADWRGRIYVQSFFANYQGSDLSLSLLEFWDGESLTEEGLNSLYIYGANLYNENNISKASYETRIKWTKDNKDKILSMNPDFIKGADEKFTFAAFCLLIKELEKDPNYHVKLPVFLDATCSGIQHLAALIKDCDLAKEVNLIPKEGIDIPADIYELLRIPINEEIRRVGREDNLYPNLEYVNLSRKDVKQPIMTKTYNVTRYGVTEQLIANFTESKSLKATSIIEGHKVTLNKTDVIKIANIIYNSVYTKYPGLNLIYNYFIEMAKLISKLGLPITWLTPSGLKLTQYYNKSKQTKIAITLGGKTNKLVLREMTDKLDKAKQSSAIIPNVIHSLDSSHVANVILTGFDYYSYDIPIITIHDCFGTHPNYMDSLTETVKLEFIKLYTSESFLEKFHDRNLQSIIDYGYSIERDTVLGQDYVLYRTRSKIYVPNKPHLGNLDLWKIKDSKYLIT